MARRSPARFLRAFALSAVAGLAVLTTFLAWVDPYGIYRHTGIPTAGYPEMTWSRIAAAERVAHRCQVAIVGSSRGLYGFGTRLPRMGGRRVCNGSLGGTSMKELGEMVRFITTETQVEGVLLLLDLAIFHDGRGYNDDFLQSRLNPDRSALTYHLWALTSVSAIEDSFATLGWRTPFFDPPPPAVATVFKNRRIIRASLNKEGLFRHFEMPDESLRIFEDMLDQLEAADIQVTVMLPPVHAMQLELYWSAGLWETNKLWRSYLTYTLAARGIPAWDFATFHSSARTPMPLTPLEPPNPWFADITHQTQALGTLTLERAMDDYRDSDTEWDSRFGVLLTPALIERHLAALDDGREQWRREEALQARWFDALSQEVVEEPGRFATDVIANRAKAADSALARAVGEAKAAWEASLSGATAPP